MVKVIKKWKLILHQDESKNITYSRDVLNEMLDDFKQQVKNLDVPVIIQQSKQLTTFVEYCEDVHGIFIPNWVIDGYIKNR